LEAANDLIEGPIGETDPKRTGWKKGRELQSLCLSEAHYGKDYVKEQRGLFEVPWGRGDPSGKGGERDNNHNEEGDSSAQELETLRLNTGPGRASRKRRARGLRGSKPLMHFLFILKSERGELFMPLHMLGGYIDSSGWVGI